MTKNVYILTEESKGYSDKGLEYLTNYIVNNLKETANLNFIGGAIVNDATFLAEQLNKHTDSYVVISNSKDITVISKRNINILKDMLLANKTNTSWNTANLAQYLK